LSHLIRSLHIQLFDYHMKYLSAIVLIIVILFSSCADKEETIDLDAGYDYFPTEVGKWLIYQADSMVWDKFKNTTYQVNFFIKEEVINEFTDSQGQTSVRIDRSYSSDGNNWKKRDTWLATANENYAERVEENARFLKLAFPLLVGKQWKGNAYLNESSEALFPSNNSNWEWDWDYEVISINKTYTNGALSFNDVTEIQQQPSIPETALRKTLGVEHYARGIGLVSKELIILLDDDEDLSGEWPDKTIEGYIYNQRLIDHN